MSTQESRQPALDKRCLRQAAKTFRLSRNAEIVIAVSGGSDSVALATLAAHLQKPLQLHPVIAHMHHGVRGLDAQADADFVAELARKWCLPFTVIHWQPTLSGGFEQQARNARYHWLVQVARDRGAAFIATGHTRDDQVETILHRLSRGTGLFGLAGMARSRQLAPGIHLIRPLLGGTREEWRDWLQSQDQPFRTDQTNFDLRQTRARIRNQILPCLRDGLNPGVDLAILRLGYQARAWRRQLNRSLDELLLDLGRGIQPGETRLDRDGMLRQPAILQAEILRRVWRDQGWPERQMDQDRWLRLVRDIRLATPRRDLGSGVALEINAGLVVLHRVASPLLQQPPITPGILPVPGSWVSPAGELRADTQAFPAARESIRRDAIQWPEPNGASPHLFVRTPRAGDRFQPLGMTEGHKQLSAYLRERGVAAHARSRVPLVCDSTGILWVAGHGIAERARIRDASDPRIHLGWVPATADGTPDS